MDEAYLTRLATKLCSADMICGYISVKPVLDNRDELIERRLDHYHITLLNLWNKLLREDKVSNTLPDDPLLESAVDLTCADMVSEAISLAPVLYTRDDKVIEHLMLYMKKLTAAYANRPIATAVTAGTVGEIAEDRAPPSVPNARSKKKKQRR